jgi:hypothetical protein
MIQVIPINVLWPNEGSLLIRKAATGTAVILPISKEKVNDRLNVAWVTTK